MVDCGPLRDFCSFHGKCAMGDCIKKRKLPDYMYLCHGHPADGISCSCDALSVSMGRTHVREFHSRELPPLQFPWLNGSGWGSF